MLRRGRWWVTAAAVLGVLATGRLGFWQLDRAAQKQALQQRIDSRQLLKPLPASQLARTSAEAEAQHFRRVQLQGHWLPQHTVFLDNRQMNSRVGFFVMTPLQLADGDAVLVQRGWLPRSFQQRDALPAVATPTGLVQVDGRVAPGPAKLFELGTGEAGRIRQNLGLSDFGREVGVALRPVSVQQLAPATSVNVAAGVGSTPAAAIDDGLLRQWPAPAVDLGKHHGYAFQWFALCALITGLYVWFQFIQPRRR